MIGISRTFLAEHNLLVVFTTALFLRLIFFLFGFFNNGLGFGINSADAYGYNQLAINLVEGNGFSLGTASPYVPDTFRTPVYPSFIALVYLLFGPKPYVSLCFQILLGSLTCALTLLLERRIFKKRSRYISGWIMAIYPLSIAYDNALLTESLFTFLLLTSMYSFIMLVERFQIRYAWMCGLLLGLTTLCRPVGVFLPIVLMASLSIYCFVKSSQHRWPRIILACVCLYISCYVVIYPWTLRNKSISGNGQISQMHGSSSVWMVPLAYVRALRCEKAHPRGLINVPEELLNITDEYNRISKLPESLAESERSRFWKQAYDDFSEVQPPFWQLQIWGLMLTSFSPQTYFVESLLGVENAVHVNIQKGFAMQGLQGVLELFYAGKTFGELLYIASFAVASVILYVLAFCCAKRNYRSPVIIALILVVCYFIFAPGPSGDGRYRVPAMPFIAVLASCGFGHLAPKRKWRDGLRSEESGT